jgi:hypothetical protein
LNDGIVYTPINLPYTAGVSISADIDAGKFSILQGLTEFDLATTEQAMAGIAGLIPDSAGVLATINQFDFLSSASIETNLNGNGRYWKFPNGLLICIRNMGANYVPGSWKYWPLPFIDDKYAVAGISTVSGGNDPDIENLLSVKLTLKGPSAYKPWLHMVVGFNGEVKPVRFEYDIIAIGRWKE